MRGGLARAVAALAVSVTVATAAPALAQARRVVSLDQCADQYVLALAPETIVGLSPRADNPDSWLRARAAGMPRLRASAESLLAARPDVVVRYWGGDARLTGALTRRGVRVLTIAEAEDLAGVRANVRAVASGLGRSVRGEALIAHMDARLTQARGAWRGRPALYLTPGAFTAGRGTLIDAALRWVGLRNLAVAAGYQPAPTERLVLSPPAAVVRGFFDQVRWTRWAPGRASVLQRAVAGRTVAELPAGLLGCPAWFVGEAAERLAAGAPRR